MNKIIILIFGAFLLTSCYSKKLTFRSDPENFTVREISLDSAKIYRENYTNDPKIKADFREGMYIPVKIIDAIRTEQGINGIMVYYGKSPEFKSPVFILTGTKDIFNYKRRDVYKGRSAQTAYLVYFPCPTHCGK